MSTPARMQAAVTEAPDRMAVRTVPVPQPGPGEVLVRVRAVGICGTDVQVHRGQLPAVLPLVLGHEYAGEVAAAGPGVNGLAIGDRVAGMGGWSCGQCDYCRRGDTALCPQRRILGRTAQGAFAEYVRVPASTVLPLPPAVTFLAAQATVTLATAFHALARLGEVQGRHVVLIGPGHAGLIMLQVLRSAGAAAVAVVGTRRERLQQALALGAAQVWEAGEDLPLSSFDVVVEAAGTPSAVRLAMELARAGGTVLVYGITKSPVDGFPAAHLYHKELNVLGSRGATGGYEPALRALAEGTVLAEPLVTHRFPITAAPAAMEAVTQRESGALRVVLEA